MSSLKTPQRQKTPQSSIARQRPSTGRVGSTPSSPPTTLSFSPSFDVHGGGGGGGYQPSPQSIPSTTTTAPLDLSYPQLHHMKVQRRADQAQRKLGVHRSMLARLQDKVITAASSPTSRPQTTSSTTTTTTPQSISKRIPTPNQGGEGGRRSSPQQRDIIITSPDSQHQRHLTPIGTSAFMSTSRRSQGLDASLCYTPAQMAMASPTPKKRPISSHRQAKREAYRDDISHRKQFLNFLSLLQNAPSRSNCGGDMVVGTSVLYPDSSSLLTVVAVGGDDDGDIPPRQPEGVLMVTLASSGGGESGGRWDMSECGVFRMGDIESVYSPLEPHQQLPYPVTVVVIQGRLLPQDMVGVASVVSSHPTLQELHLPDTPLDPFLRRTLNDITSSNINIQQVSWKSAQSTPPPQSSPRPPQNTAKTSNTKTSSSAVATSSVFIRMSDITGSPTPSSTESDTEDDYYGTHENHHHHNINTNIINHDGSSSMYHSLLQHSRRRSRRRRRSSSGGGRSSVGSSSASRSQSIHAATRNNRTHQPDEDDWCLEEGGMSDNECDAVSGAMSPYLGYYPPACQSRRQTLMTNPASGRPSLHVPPQRGTASLSITDERLTISGTIGRPPRSPTSLPLEVSGIAATQHTANTTTATPLTTTITTPTSHQSPYCIEGPSSSMLPLRPWQERLIQYLQAAHPTLGPSPTKTALKWLHALQSQLHSNRRAVARRNKRRAHEANLSTYIERLDTMCFQVFSELVVSERMLRTDITELQTAQRTHLYSLERQEGKRAHRRDQARRLLEEIEQRMEWVQGREGAFRDALAEEELSIRLAIFVEGMQPSGRSAIIATEVAVRSYAKAFESSSWAHYRGLQRSRQTRQQAEKDVIVAVESKGRSLIIREWVSGLRRGKEKERADAEEVSLRPTHSTLVEIALTRPPPLT